MAINPISLAITVALSAANMAMSAMREIEGPRVNTSPATIADYGTPLNYFVGERFLACPVFFSKPIKEVKKKRKGKAGKQVSYTGYGSWAVHVADHAIVGIAQIWFDNHLVFDATGGEEKIYPLAEDYELTAHMRIYMGSEAQDPDPDMEAYIEARDGPGTCPAYRGTSWIYFENVPLEALGNRFPDVKVLTRYATWQLRPSWDFEVTITVNSTVHGVTVNGYIYPAGPVSSHVVIDSAPNASLVKNFTSTHRFTMAPGSDSVGTWGFTVNVGGNPFGEGPPNNLTEVTIDFRHWAHGSARVIYAPPAWNGLVGRNIFASHDNTIDWMDFLHGHVEYDAGDATTASVEQLLTFVGERIGLDPGECDWSKATQEFTGYNWTQATGKQILEPILDLFDIDVRPHDFMLEALPRGSASQGALPTGEFVLGSGGDDEGGAAPFTLTPMADSDLPRRVFLTYADASAQQNPNVATPPGPDPEAAGTLRELSIDMQTLALQPDTAQQLAERRLRRVRFGRIEGEFGLTRQRVGIEPGDVWTPEFDGDATVMRCTKLVYGADGRLATTWERDDPAIGALSGSAGGASAGYIPASVPDAIATIGDIMDLPLLIDAHDQSAPFAYLVGAPAEPGMWLGADFAKSDTGELDSYDDGWDAIAADSGAVIGICADALPDALPWVPDNGSVLTVTINAGELTAATLDDVLADPTRNLAAVRSGSGWEIVQFLTPTLVAARTYEITGFLRGVRGTEWAIAGHAPDDRFVLLDGAVKRHTMGASELGDTDWYVVSSLGHTPDQAEAFALTYTGAAHRPYAPVDAAPELSGADWLVSATRRTRLGGGSLDNQDVPLGEASESWELDILDGADVVRTIAGTSLPLTWTEAQQITDFGLAQTEISARLYQKNPILGLRGYPLDIAA